MKIVLPLPPRELHPNARPHWRTRAKHTRAYRNRVFLELQLAFGHPPKSAPWERATIRLTYYFKAAAVRDGDALQVWFKAGTDALRVPHYGVKHSDYPGWGLIVDDSIEHLTHLPVRVSVDRANPRVEVEVEEAHSAVGGAAATKETM